MMNIEEFLREIGDLGIKQEDYHRAEIQVNWDEDFVIHKSGNSMTVNLVQDN